jgi:aminopeptidase-like protein
MNHQQYKQLKDGVYRVFIDSTLENGHLSYAECFIGGEIEEEVLISCHICHPSLCNDNLSGIAVTVYLAKLLLELKLQYSYRFLFIPATIGSITWLALNKDAISKIRHGLVAANLGDSGPFTYKRSRRNEAEIDLAVANVLKQSGFESNVVDFIPYGYDERQYCSPGFDLPVGCLMRTPQGEYPEYHTSADNMDFVHQTNLIESLTIYRRVVDVLENNKRYINLNPNCEPQLGRRGLYAKIGGQSDSQIKQLCMLWVLNLSDGNYSLLDIANRSGLDFTLIKQVSDLLLQSGLLQEV